MNNIEKIVYEYLQGRNFNVYMQAPESNPIPDEPMPSFVLIQKTGSGMTERLMEATLAIQSYGPSFWDASELNASIIEAMLDIISLDPITKITLNSDYEFADTERKQPRYQAVFDIVYYAD